MEVLTSFYLINSGFVDDVLGTVGVSQGAQCLTVVYVSWGNGWGEFKERKKKLSSEG